MQPASMLYPAPWGWPPITGIYRERPGTWAYRYNDLPNYADIHNAGRYLAGRIPRDDTKREEWVRQTIASIENELLWRTQRGIPTTETVYSELEYTRRSWKSFTDIAPDHPVDDRRQIAFEQIIPDYDLEWLYPRFMARTWTYVIDLEDRAFTVHGILHFSFDRMPPHIAQSLVQPLTSTTYFKMTPQAEMMYSTFVQRWPPLFKQPSEDCTNAYASMLPIITTLDEWGTRAWDDLNAAEALSVHLVATILLDQSTQIRNPDIIGDRRMFAYCQWQLLTAAAPSALVLTPPPVPSDYSSQRGVVSSYYAIDWILHNS
ncbi:unnamed protein product [Rhizoctonia solani]|uniref:Uncharacterized protein n=1 Tax=Rhizoctonia solani TaxID=456999 RepID=A0A8H2XJS6_9AGAM|nr:unnamed protein product [Rhizoctonia solani]